MGVLIGALLILFSSAPRVPVYQPAQAPLLSPAEVYSLVCQDKYLWNCERMYQVAYKESKFDPEAVNYDCYPGHILPTGEPYKCIGLLQIMESNVWYIDEVVNLYNPAWNVDFAYYLWLNSESDPWSY